MEKGREISGKFPGERDGSSAHCIFDMEKDLKELVDKYIETNSVKLVQKAAPAPKQPKAPKKAAEKKPKEEKHKEEVKADPKADPKAESTEKAVEEAPKDGKKVECGLGK